ncbi:MAG: response regulator [Sphingobium sp.]
MHILIIEDEALLAMNLRIFLEELGADSCAVAASEAEAIREALSRPPDLIASDVTLLEGSGPSAVRSIKARLGDIPVVYVTGQPGLIRDMDPAVPVVAKPILWLDLVQAVEPYGLPPRGEARLSAT